MYEWIPENFLEEKRKNLALAIAVQQRKLRALGATVWVGLHDQR
nr:hypothetical protein [Nostoc sp. ChiSLP03a]MDZ8211568.1 hypothetical protein [Nostoc sp. ChiSLP03a]